ncbi:MAG: hypothetical protein FJ010_03845 [Chloroflexi bacterium]|nr:hypothetical protein [Chloroflexota bacterium]
MKTRHLDEDTLGIGAGFDRRAALSLLVALFALVLIKNAWVGDDSYITVRTIENFLSGYGLTFNITERVLTNTHPLWMFLQAGVYFLLNRVLGIYFWAEFYYLNVLISLTLSILTIYWLLFRNARSFGSAILGMAILVMSKAFVDYSTSGLENPLTHFFLMVFLWVFLDGENSHPRRLFYLSLIAALGGLNRLDTLLLYLPVIVYEFWQDKNKKRAIYQVLSGFSPLLLWELFSLFYYGFLFPNTYYSKLNTGIPFGRLARQGLYYYLNSLSLDPITLLVIVLSSMLTFVSKQRRHLPIVIGVALYFLYIVRIGGDFMSGRFFAAPLLISVILLTRTRFEDIKAYLVILAVVLVVGLTSPRPPVMVTSHPIEQFEGKPKIDEKGVSDERLFYFRTAGLLVDNRSQVFPGSRFAGRQWISVKEHPEVEIAGALGDHGYVTGPDVHVIDLFALADPLMARLPTLDLEVWRIGHFRRDIPEGYLESLTSGENRIKDPHLAQYYDKLSIVIRGDLFDWDRLIEIWYLNTGKYDYLLEAYIAERGTVQY